MTDSRVGVDLVDVASFERRFDGRDEVLAQIFTPAELAYALGQHRPWPHLAARFAAKEATLKALGIGLAGGITWRDVEVTRDEAGMPSLLFHDAMAPALAREGLARGSVSLSHTEDHAVAVVLLYPG